MFSAARSTFPLLQTILFYLFIFLNRIESQALRKPFPHQASGCSSGLLMRYNIVKHCSKCLTVVSDKENKHCEMKVNAFEKESSAMY